MKKQITIELPFTPISLNKLLGMNRWERAKFTKERKEEVAWLVKEKKVKKFPVNIDIIIISGNKHKKDSGNYVGKAILDGLILGGLIPDDNTDYIRKVSFEVRYGEKDKTIIKI